MTPKPTDEATAESAFEHGLAAFAAEDASRAHAAFERAYRRDPREPRYMSWYGLTLVLVERNSNLGLVLSDQSIRLGGADPILLLNQARIHLALNQRERTIRTVQRGLDLWPDHPALLHARDALGWRRRPVLPFLSRKSALNRLLGRLRHRWRRSPAGFGPCTPMTLGVPPRPPVAPLQLTREAPPPAEPGAPTPPEP